MEHYHRRVVIILLLLETIGLLVSAGVWLLTRDVLVTTMSAFVITVLNAYIASVIILTPLERLVNLIEKIGQGNFKARIKHGVPKSLQNTKNNLNELAAHFDDFFAQSHAEKERYSAELDLLRAAFNSVSVGIIGIDEKGAIEMMNQAAASIIGVRQEKALGKGLGNVLPLVYRSERILEKWFSSAKEKLRDEYEWELVEFENRKGEKINLDISAYYSKTLTQQLRAVIVLIDKTAQRSVEDKKIDFLAMAAHELRTPVTVIRGYLETLEEELQTTLTEQQRSDLNRVNYSASRLSSYISNVLNVSRIEQGNIDLDFVATDYNDLLQEVIEDLAQKAKTRGHLLEFYPEENLPKVTVDRATISEVINNLVDNAIKYSHPNGRIIVKTERMEDGVQTTVQDFGVGIPRSLMNKLFTKFYRSHRTRGKYLGTGLGLYMSKKILDAHQGTIWVKSKENEGSTFGFILPTDPAIAKNLENNNNEISRGIHGWIKNHSLYRR